MGEAPFEGIVEAHHREIHRYLGRLTRGSAIADDLAQETFLRAYRSWKALPEGANVRAWLFTIATNVMRNHFRGEKRRTRAHDTVKASTREAGPDRPDGAASASEALTLVESVVATLPLKQRSAFVLRKVHELEYDAIGGALGCSADSARAHVFQALRKIRHGLDGRELTAVPEVPR
ncbi:MAG: RNA polymerase sigma factor [Candidatus Rokubacteria bacterium]|nr:RNA polymerase sigma factor [Candidatus Rokubacteria bacterium]